jgi:hypothetical protein
MPREKWGAWLDPATPARTLLGPCPAGALKVESAG